MTILITGGAGFIGSRLMERLGDEQEVVILDNFHEQVHGAAIVVPASTATRTIIRGDVTSPEDWDDLLARFAPESIVHLAAETGTGQSLLESSRHTNVNVNGTAVMLDALVRNRSLPSSIVLTSSRAVYGEGLWEDPDTLERFYGMPRTASRLDQGDWQPTGPTGQRGSPLPHRAQEVEPRPSNVYAATKLAQENILTAWCASMEVSLSVLRLQNVYGRGQALRNAYTGVLTAFARQVLNHQEVDVFEGGGIIRDFVHVTDITVAIQAALHKPALVGAPRTLDIGSGTPGTLEEFASALAGLVPGAGYATSSNYRLGDVRSAWADNSAAHDDLGYVPSVSFNDGATELLAWAQEEIKRGQ